MNAEKVNVYHEKIFFPLFKNCQSGQGFPLPAILDKAKDFEGKELEIFLSLLLSNGYLDEKNNNFYVLSKKGYKWIKEGVPLTLEISLVDLLSFSKIKSKGRDFVFNELWNLIGVKDSLFYVKGPDFYNKIKPFIKGAYPTYTKYITYLQDIGEPTSRSNWYCILFNQLDEEDVEKFLVSLSSILGEEDAK